MKEIDFLPEWYKSGRRRQINYRTQCIVLGGAMLVAMVWNFTMVRSISKATAELNKPRPMEDQLQNLSQEYTRLASQIGQLQKKARQIEELDSRIDVSSILGELSFLVDAGIVLHRLELIAEKFENGQDATGSSGSAVRLAVVGGAGNNSAPLGRVRFKVLIKGVARNAAAVAELVVKLEDSPYFRDVTSSWKNKTIKVAQDKKTFNASEFEISCYLANYRLSEMHYAKETHQASLDR